MDIILVAVIFYAHLQNVPTVNIFCAARLDMCVKYTCFKMYSFLAQTSIFEAQILLHTSYESGQTRVETKTHLVARGTQPLSSYSR